MSWKRLGVIPKTFLNIFLKTSWNSFDLSAISMRLLYKFPSPWIIPTILKSNLVGLVGNLTFLGDFLLLKIFFPIFKNSWFETNLSTGNANPICLYSSVSLKSFSWISPLASNPDRCPSFRPSPYSRNVGHFSIFFFF